MLKNRKGIIQKIRNSRTFKGVAVCMALNLLVEMTYPSVTYALTSGPTQPEVQSFEPIGTTQMVDLFSGDFNYNIPLFNLPGPNGGYPVNIAYHAGIGMDDEASWVGLGWNLNVGSLVRNMRGLPDEFLSQKSGEREANGAFDYVEVKSDMKQSWTLGLSFSGSPEVETVGGPLFSSEISASLYYNNYKGLGTSAGSTLAEVGKNQNFSLGFSLDSENGLGVSASLKDISNDLKHSREFELDINFNGNLAVDYSLKARDYIEGVEGASGSIVSNNYSSNYSFSTTAFTPSVAQSINYYSLSANVALGAQASILSTENIGLGIFFNTQDYDDLEKKGRKIPVMGYDRSGETTDKWYTRDFMRQNEGQITKESVVLPNSYYTFDTYVSTGQGLAGYFRPRRNDIGKSNDPYNRNVSGGIHLGFDAAGGAGAKLGVNVGVNFGWETQGAWMDSDSPNSLDFDFLNPTSGNEIVYYQAHGEQTIMLNSDLDYLGGLGLATVRLKSKDTPGGGKRAIDDNVNFDNEGHSTSHRFVRNTLIQAFSNNEVRDLGEFNVKVYQSPTGSQLYSNPAVSFNRSTRNNVNIGTHKAGFKVLNEEGSYYVYGLPAYNKKEVENLFSVEEPQNPEKVANVGYSMDGNEVDYKVQGSNSHKFINKTTKSPYAHSFLLTSVQGADYVDLTNNGPTDDDMGYWVKFDYQLSTDDYQWRAPYKNNEVKYHRNHSYTSADDKGSYQYGEKEVWYLARMETKSHIAIFKTKSRTDNLEAEGEYTSVTADDDRGLALDEILIYEKKNFSAAATPLQTIKFHYAGDPNESNVKLCNGISNGDDGKLTLTGISFNSMGSTRGNLSKYEFEYAGINGFSGINPDYQEYSFDGWGVYKLMPDETDANYDADLNEHFPYTEQFDQGLYPQFYGDYSQGKTTQQIQDDMASAWCLKQIKLPSGGKINIEYESDDYGYVQHKTATQMFKINGLNDLSANNELYVEGGGNNDFYDPSSNTDEKRRRIYFKLEKPISTSETGDLSDMIYKDYVEPLIQDESGNRNLYFKSRMRLLKDPSVFDYVSGYLPLEPYSEQCYGVANIVGNNYTTGYVTIQAAKKKNGGYFDQYHPMALAAWTYLQTNAQELLNNPNSFNSSEPNDDNIMGEITDIINVIPMLMTSFGGIRTYCKSKDMARFIDLEKSCIRLASPDKKKFGGGHRVKQISITDEWSADTDSEESSRTYGMIYEYTMWEGNKKISSGVAQYEPQAIGDEIALKYPIYFYGKSSIFTSNNLFSEAPLNEHLFPGASVGYSRVTTRSLNTNTQKNSEASNPGNGGTGRTGGETVTEFYTAREFPTMVRWSILSESQNTMGHFNVPIPMPFIGSLTRRFYHGTQAFLIETNDMHGKLKSVKTYEVNGFKVNPNPITETVYEYQSKPITYQGEHVYKLDNEVSVIPNDGTHAMHSVKRLMGVEVDLFTDQRESKNYNQGAGLDFNVDVPMPPAFIPTPWPSINYNKSLFRTYTTNKIVHRSGILKKTKTRDLQAVNESEIMAYDERSGTPILTRVKNEFGDDFYNYNIPAYYHYDRMGHAYRNINYMFEKTVSAFTALTTSTGTEAFIQIPASGLETHLVRGDELIITQVDSPGNTNNQFCKAYFTGWAYDANNDVYAKLHLLDIQTQGSASDYTFKVIRSGRRNHYTSVAASYVTKGRLDELLSGTEELEGSLTTPIISDNVVSASASLYKDDWSTSARDVGQIYSYVKNPFMTGNSGIWRPYKSYSYVGPRKSSAKMLDSHISDESPVLSEDGVMDSVPMFSWEIGSMENYVSNWEWVNEVTRHSDDAYELENINRLGIRSSALYGYDNSLTIAVGGNSEMHELGAADFEQSSSANFNTLLKQTNLNFDNNHSSGSMLITEKFAIVNALCVNQIADLQILTDMPYSYSQSVGIADIIGGDHRPICGLELISKNTSIGPVNEGYYFNGSIYSIDNVNGYARIHVKAFLENMDEIKHLLKVGATFHGKATFFHTRTYNSGQSVTYSNSKAHTGKSSMEVTSTVTFEQPKLRAIPDKSYVLSMWVSRQNTRVVSYEVANLVQVGTVSGGTFTAITPESVKFGKIVEGWQKVDIVFSVPTLLANMAFRFNPGASTLYVDDVRFSPKTGGITTYVYNRDNFRLMASLNVDNYATLFFYDEEGNLTLKKQETEKGIFTITESRGHVSED